MLGGYSILDLVLVLVVILLSMTLHEAMHGFVAYYLGDDTAKLQGRLTFNPIKHIDPFMTILLPLLLAISGGPIFGGAKPVPFNPYRLRYGEWGMALVAVSGPLTNFVIAFVTFGALVMSHSSVDSFLGSVLYTATLVNLGFFVFNIIPIPPLDGSRVLYALAPDFFRRWMEQVERFGIIGILLIVVVAGPLLGTYMSSVIQFFITVFSHIFGV